MPYLQDATGNYPIERRAGEIERLLAQGAAREEETRRMFDRIGVAPGWRCLDLGCGPRGITDLLAERVGPTGSVVGLDRDPVFIDFARRHATRGERFEVADGYRAPDADGSFDLVHVRFVAGTAGEPETLIRKMIRLVRPGGVVVLQEPEWGSLRCFPPHPAFTTLADALGRAFASVGADVSIGPKLFPMLQRLGLRDVAFRPFLLGFRHGDGFADFLPASCESMHGAILKAGLLDQAGFDASLRDCRAHLAEPGTLFTLYGVFQVWGRKPA